MPRIQRGIEKSFTTTTTTTSTSPSFAPQTLSIQRPSPPHLSPQSSILPSNPSRSTNSNHGHQKKNKNKNKNTVLASTTNQKKRKIMHSTVLTANRHTSSSTAKTCLSSSPPVSHSHSPRHSPASSPAARAVPSCAGNPRDRLSTSCQRAYRRRPGP